MKQKTARQGQPLRGKDTQAARIASDRRAMRVKRLCDVVISGLFLCTLYPVIWLLCAIGIKCSSKGPILFRQKRTGYKGEEFECLKFRTMRENGEADTKQATQGDERVFRFGEFLRKTSADELPQFINVFKGEMSVVGPRPHMLRHTEIYSKAIKDYRKRHAVKPGITGWAQVNGYRGETPHVEDMAARVEQDLWYIAHQSLWLDTVIFFRTIGLLFRKDNKAY